MNKQHQSKLLIPSRILKAILFVSVISFQSCKTESADNTTARSYIVATDTLEKVRIDSLVDQINKDIRAQGLPKKIPYPVFNEKDTIYYWLTDDYSGRISLEMKPPDKVDWPVYFVYKKELIKVRYRYYSNLTGNRKAYESNVYLKKGEMMYCDERGRALADEEGPGLIRQLTPEPSKRTKEEIEADYRETWKKILPLLRAQDPLAKKIND